MVIDVVVGFRVRRCVKNASIDDVYRIFPQPGPDCGGLPRADKSDVSPFNCFIHRRKIVVDRVADAAKTDCYVFKQCVAVVSEYAEPLPCLSSRIYAFDHDAAFSANFPARFHPQPAKKQIIVSNITIIILPKCLAVIIGVLRNNVIGALADDDMHGWVGAFERGEDRCIIPAAGLIDHSICFVGFQQINLFADVIKTGNDFYIPVIYVGRPETVFCNGRIVRHGDRLLGLRPGVPANIRAIGRHKRNACHRLRSAAKILHAVAGQNIHLPGYITIV